MRFALTRFPQMSRAAFCNASVFCKTTYQIKEYCMNFHPIRFLSKTSSTINELAEIVNTISKAALSFPFNFTLKSMFLNNHEVGWHVSLGKFHLRSGTPTAILSSRREHNTPSQHFNPQIQTYFHSLAALLSVLRTLSDDRYETTHSFSIFLFSNCRFWKGPNMNRAYILEIDSLNLIPLYSSAGFQFYEYNTDNFSSDS